MKKRRQMYPSFPPVSIRNLLIMLLMKSFKSSNILHLCQIAPPLANVVLMYFHQPPLQSKKRLLFSISTLHSNFQNL